MLQAASPRAESCLAASPSIGLSTAQRRNGAPLTPSPRRLDVVAKANNAAVRPHKLEGLPESMLSRANVSYSGLHLYDRGSDMPLGSFGFNKIVSWQVR